MSITVEFDPPKPSDTPDVFNNKAFALIGHLNQFATEANALAGQLNSLKGAAESAAASAAANAAAAATSVIAEILGAVGQGHFSDGSVAAPGISFSADPDTGIRRTGSGGVAIVGNGVDQAVFSGGNIGLGVTPSAWVGFSAVEHVGGAIFSNVTQIGTSQNCYVSGTGWKYRGNGYASFTLQTSGSTTWFTAPLGNSGDAITFSQSMRLDEGGRLLFNTGSFGYSNSNNIMLAGGAGRQYLQHMSGTASGATYSEFTYNGALIGSITQNGTTGISINTTSDKDLKDDLGICESSDVILSTKIHDFSWKADGKVDRGVFAQEAYLVKPSAVLVGSDEVSEAGQKVLPWSVDYSKYVPDLIVTDQMQERRISDLEAKLAAALVRIEALEAA